MQCYGSTSTLWGRSWGASRDGGRRWCILKRNFARRAAIIRLSSRAEIWLFDFINLYCQLVITLTYAILKNTKAHHTRISTNKYTPGSHTRLIAFPFFHCASIILYTMFRCTNPENQYFLPALTSIPVGSNKFERCLVIALTSLSEMTTYWCINMCSIDVRWRHTVFDVTIMLLGWKQI